MVDWDAAGMGHPGVDLRTLRLTRDRVQSARGCGATLDRPARRILARRPRLGRVWPDDHPSSQINSEAITTMAR
jgi:hypothetical protein